MRLTYIPRLKFDRQPFLRGGSFCIVSVSLMHFVQAILLFWSHHTGDATNMLAFLFFIKEICVDGIIFEIASFVFIFTSVLAICGTLLKLGWIRIVTLLPQHFILTIMTIGGLYASWIGTYLDGTKMQWEHILADQMPLVALFIVHSSAILRRVNDPNG